MKIANETGVAINKVSPVLMFDNLLLKKFHNSGVVLADSNTTEKYGIKGGYTGGIGEGGLFQDVVVFDANSLYPSIILNKDFKGDYAEVWKIMKEFIQTFIKERKRFKSMYEENKIEEYNTTQMMYKIFANSLYGALEYASFRFFSEDMAGFITEEGRKIALKLRDIVKNLGFTPIYGDTDSLFVGNINGKEYMLQDIINQKLYPLEVKVEKKFKKILFLTNNKGEITKKRYAGVDTNNKLLITGLEVIRSDWCSLARNSQRKVLEMLLIEGKGEREIEQYMRDIITNIRSVPVKELMFVRTVDLTKNYDKSLRHVKVAEQLGYYKTKRKLVFVSYILGQKNIPIPVEEGDNAENYKSFVDYSYYIERQVKPPITRILKTISNKQTKLVLVLE